MKNLAKLRSVETIEVSKLKPGHEVRCFLNGKAGSLKVVNVIKVSGHSHKVIVQYEQFFPYPIEYGILSTLTIFK